MDEKDWQVFFGLLERIVSSDGTANEKAAEVCSQATQFSAGMYLDEFLSWNFEG